MGRAYFQVPLTVEPQRGGTAVLRVPKSLDNLAYQFVRVRDGGEEAVVAVEAADDALRKLEKSAGIRRLSSAQLNAVRDADPAASLKKRLRAAPEGAGAARDAASNKAQVETVQTVRVGFYLIDVLIQPD